MSILPVCEYVNMQDYLKELHYRAFLSVVSMQIDTVCTPSVIYWARGSLWKWRLHVQIFMGGFIFIFIFFCRLIGLIEWNNSLGFNNDTFYHDSAWVFQNHDHYLSKVGVIFHMRPWRSFYSHVLFISRLKAFYKTCLCLDILDVQLW